MICVACTQNTMAKAFDHGWPIDPSVTKHGQTGGPPPDGHPRRCQGLNRYLSARAGKGIQCGRWALVGRSYCRQHGGTQERLKTNVAARRWYSKHAGSALRAKLDEMSNAPPDERISLESEIDVARVLAVQSIACFDKICVQGETGTADEETAMVMKAQATVAAREAMSFVAGIVDKAAKVRSVSQGTIDLELVGYIVHQVQSVIERHIVPLKDGHALCDRIVADLNAIRMPDRQHAETTADDRAAEVRALLGEMDMSVTGASMNGRAG